MNTELQNALNKMAQAKAKWDAAKTKRAWRDAQEDFEFWSNKAAMLEVMARKCM